MAEFVLHVQDLDEAGKDYAFELSHAWLDSHLSDATLRHDPAFGPGTLEVHAQENDSGEYLVTGTLSVHVLTECGRCLGDAKLAVDTAIATLFGRNAARPSGTTHTSAPERRARAERQGHHARHASDRDREAEADDAELMPREEFTGNDIQLDELVREHIVLEVPMQPLCSETCAGIAIPEHLRPPADVFPTSTAVDPRLAPLQRLRDNVPPTSQASAPSGTRPASSTAAAARKQPGNRQPKPKTKSNKE